MVADEPAPLFMPKTLTNLALLYVEDLSDPRPTQTQRAGQLRPILHLARVEHGLELKGTGLWISA